MKLTKTRGMGRWSTVGLAIIGIAAMAFGVQGIIHANSPTGAPVYQLDTSVISSDGTIGDQITATVGTPSGADMINPLLVSRSNGNGNTSVYVYNNAGPDANTRVITVFDEDGNFIKNISVDISAFPGFVPKGMTIGADGRIWLTPSGSNINGYLAIYYDTINDPNPILQPVYAGRITGFSSTGNLGVPTIDQVTGNIVVAGQFQTTAGYGAAIINITDGTVGLKIPIWGGGAVLNSATVYNVVVAPNGDYFAVGRFQFTSGESSDVIKFNPSSDAVTPIVANNVYGNGWYVSNWNINGINIDNSGNIYLSGQVGVTPDGGSTSQFTIIKMDGNGNFVTTVAPYDATAGATLGDVGNIQDPGRVHINTDNQAVYVLDTDTAGNKWLKKYVIQLTMPTPPTNVTVDPDTGMIKVDPPLNTGGTNVDLGMITVDVNDSSNPPSQVIVPPSAPGTPTVVLPGNLIPCHSYTISVTATNVVGSSTPVTTDYTHACTNAIVPGVPNTGLNQAW